MRARVAVAAVALLAAGCAPCAATPSDTPPPGSRAAPPGGVGAEVGWTEERCVASAAPSGSTRGLFADADLDGLADGCEMALAYAFAPLLVVDPDECGWNAERRMLDGGWLWAVGRARGDGPVRVAYLPAYVDDCGWSLPACAVLPRTCRPHAGDSEAIVVELRPLSGGRWRTARVFLSAHCHGRSDGRCRWFEGAELERFRRVDGRVGGAPVVWVASGKHANYPSPGACDAGHWGFDACDRNTASFHYPIDPLRNLGSHERPTPALDTQRCVPAFAVGLDGVVDDPNASECPWDDDRFRGWRGGGEGATGYAVYLREVAEL